MIHSSGSIGEKKRQREISTRWKRAQGVRISGSDVTNACTSLRHRKCRFANARRTVSNKKKKKKNEVMDAPYEF